MVLHYVRHLVSQRVKQAMDSLLEHADHVRKAVSITDVRQ